MREFVPPEYLVRGAMREELDRSEIVSAYIVRPTLKGTPFHLTVLA